MQLIASRGSAVGPADCQADCDGAGAAPVATVVGVVETLAVGAVEGGVLVETGVTDAAVVEVDPRMPATAFFWAAVGLEGDEQPARSKTLKSAAARPKRLRSLIVADRSA